MSLLASLEKGALYTTPALSIVGLCALMGLATMTLVDGSMRWLLNRPIDGVRDVGALAIAMAVSCSLPMVFIERGNVAIRVAGSLLGPLAGRVLDLFAAMLVLLVLVLMAWQFQVFASKLAQGNETTWVLQIRVAPFWYIVDAILWCAVLVQLIVAARDLVRVVSPQDAGA